MYIKKQKVLIRTKEQLGEPKVNIISFGELTFHVKSSHSAVNVHRVNVQLHIIQAP